MEDLKLFIQQEIMDAAFVKVDYDDLLLTNKLIDSITIVDIIVSIEEHIGKKFPQNVMQDENFDTINKMIETIQKLY
jgi:acyl carrier protein